MRATFYIVLWVLPTLTLGFIAANSSLVRTLKPLYVRGQLTVQDDCVCNEAGGRVSVAQVGTLANERLLRTPYYLTEEWTTNNEWYEEPLVYTKRLGVVHITGKAKGAYDQEAFAFPNGWKPEYALTLPSVESQNQEGCNMQVTKEGVISFPSDKMFCYQTTSGMYWNLHFPSAGTTFVTLDVENSWASVGGDYGPVRVTKIGNHVLLGGRIAESDPCSTVSEIFTAVPTGWLNEGSGSLTDTMVCGTLGTLLVHTANTGFATGETASKTFTGLGSHTHLLITVEAVMLDTWDNEEIILNVDGSQVEYQIWQRNQGKASGDHCGGGGSYDALYTLAANIVHTSSSALLEFSSNIGSSASDEAWGLKSVCIRAITVSGTLYNMFTLPVGYRPSHRMSFPAASARPANCRVDILPTGEVGLAFPNNCAVSWISLDSIRFPVDVTWTNFTLLQYASWLSPVYPQPCYTVVDNLVYLTGAFTDTGGSSIQHIFSLPVGARPQHSTRLLVALDHTTLLGSLNVKGPMIYSYFLATGVQASLDGCILLLEILPE